MKERKTKILEFKMIGKSQETYFTTENNKQKRRFNNFASSTKHRNSY